MNKVVSKSKCGRRAMIITSKGTKHVQMKNGAWRCKGGKTYEVNS